MSETVGGIDYLKIKEKLEEVWQSGGAGRETLREELDRQLFSFVRLPKLIPLAEFDKLVIEPTEDWEKNDIHRSYILKLPGKLVAYYQVSDGSAIGYAESTDFIHWTKLATPIITGGWYSVPCVLKLGSNDWRMWVESSTPTELLLKYFTSTDGKTWTEHPESPLLRASREIYTDAFGRFRVLYDNVNDSFIGICHYRTKEMLSRETEAGRVYLHRIGFSPDGLSWEFPSEYDPIVFKRGGDYFLASHAYVNQFFRLGDTYVVVGESEDYTKSNFCIFIAYSKDLKKWFIDPTQYIFSVYNWKIGPNHADPTLIPITKGIWHLYHCQYYPPLNPGKHGVGLTILSEDGRAKVSYPILEVNSLAAGSSTSLDDCQGVHLNLAKTLSITVECTYDTEATNPLRAHLRSSVDGVNFDTDDYASFDLPLAAGQTVRITKNITADVNCLKVILENLDSSVSVSDITVYAVVGA